MSLFWIFVGIAVLGLMVLVHEWGHFIVAKLFGVRVDVFSIGFGPRLFGRRRGATDYRMSALPLGGYVKMAGDNPTEERAGAPDEFLSKPRWQRALIALAGPVTNIVMAVLLLTGLYTYHYVPNTFLDEEAVVGGVRENSPAAQAGLQVGDRIVRFGPARRPTWEDLFTETTLSMGDSVAVEVERESARLSLQLAIPEDVRDRPWEIGLMARVPTIVQSLAPDSPGAQAGLQPGDVLLAINGKPLHPSNPGENPVSERLQESGGQPAVLTIEREGVRQEVTVTPVYGDHPEGKRWVMGVSLGYLMTARQLSLPQAFRVSLKENWRRSGDMLTLVGRLFTGRASLRGVQGPVGIVRISGQAGESGGLPFVLFLMSVISLSLGILNLLPLPVLDGGHLAFLAVEGGLQRDISLRVKERLLQAGVLFLLLVFVVVMYNDIARIFTN